jgi:hypothetical protein
MTQAYLGVDINKAKFYVALQEEKRHNQAKIKVFPHNLSGFEQLRQWLQHHASQSWGNCWRTPAMQQKLIGRSCESARGLTRDKVLQL